MVRTGSFRVSSAPLRLAALALTLAACGGGGGNGIAFADLEAAALTATCNYLVACQEMPDQTTCHATLRSQESLFPTMRVDIAAGRVKYNPTAARACIDGLAGIRSCTRIAFASVFGAAESPCALVFSGTLPLGSACFFEEECTGSDTCTKSCATSGCCEGTCAAGPTSVPAGGDCSDPTIQVCDPGTACQQDPQTLALICTKLAPPGASCMSASACAYPYVCDSPDPFLQPGVCAAPPGPGESCSISYLCNDLRDSCDTATNICTANTPVGGSCANGSGQCVGYARCDGATCLAQGRPGESCVEEGASGCLGSLECDATLHCTLPPLGLPCR